MDLAAFVSGAVTALLLADTVRSIRNGRAKRRHIWAEVHRIEAETKALRDRNA